MTSPCERLTNFFNPFASKPNEPSQESGSEDAEALSLRLKVQNSTLFPTLTHKRPDLGSQEGANNEFVLKKRKFTHIKPPSDKPVARVSRKRKFSGTKPPPPSKRAQNTPVPILTPEKRTCHFPRLGSEVVAHGIGSFFAYRDLVSFSNINKYFDLIREVRERSVFSDIPIFRKKEYKLYWGVEITDAFEPAKINKRVLRIFLKTYFGPNPVDPTKLVKDTCLIPTVVPARVMVEGRSFDYNLNLLGDIASHPGIGENNAAKYMHKSLALDQHGEDSPQEEGHLEIVLEGVIGRDVSWESQVQCLQDLNEQTGYECETEPNARSLVAVVFAQKAARGTRAFGDNTGLEGQSTYGRTKELVQWGQNTYHVVVGSFSAGAVGPLGGTAPAELRVKQNFFAHDSFGVAVQRKFR